VRMKKSSKGVLIVIGILFILVLLGGAVVYFWVVSLHPPSKFAPEITATCERYSDDYVIVLEFVRFGAAGSMKYLITDNQMIVEDYSDYSGSDGLCTNYIQEIYGADLTFQNEDGNPISNMSFYDDNLDGRVSTGDFFVIRGVNNSDIYNKGDRIPGVGKEGLVFNLEFVPTGETICSITFSDTAPMTNKTVEKTYNRFIINNATVPKTPGLNVSTSKPVFSASPSLESNSIMIAVTVCNNDSANVSNILVRFLDDGEEFYSEGTVSIKAGDEIRVLAPFYYLEKTGAHNITVEVTAPAWDIPIQANASIIVVPLPPMACISFEVNPFPVLFTVLIVSLLSVLRKRRVYRTNSSQ